MVRPAYTNPEATLAFNLNSPEVRELIKLDDDMHTLIEAVGEVEVDIEGDGFVSLARAICDQQISIHAARAIWGRLEQLCAKAGASASATQTSTRSPVTSAAILAHDIEQLRSVGLSRSKAAYLIDLAQHVDDERIVFGELATHDDETIIAELIRIKGVGRWTAQMHLIFSLGRLDVFAPADGGLRRSVCALKGLPSDVPPAMIEAIAEDWAPYRTVASLYLWRGLGQGVIQSL
ncbi:MAG: DNA-3-methyladenine glycosylase [Coriobacteriia bacterium]|nr:DNA-3-methyladenine glycosylase [Coriobacteriia bacterium]